MQDDDLASRSGSSIVERVVSRAPVGGYVNAYVNAVKELVVIVLAILENLDVLVHSVVDGNFVVVSNRIFTQEIEDEEVRRFQCDMFAPQ